MSCTIKPSPAETKPTINIELFALAMYMLLSMYSLILVILHLFCHQSYGFVLDNT